jgi:PAS domain-containing protein
LRAAVVNKIGRGNDVRRGHEHAEGRHMMSEPLGTPGSPKSLPLILARELASNLATPMFLMDPGGMLVFYNDAAAMLLGKPFAELGEIPSGEFGAALELTTPAGEPVRRRDSPAGVAFFERRPAHMTVMATAYDGARREFEATAYPLFGATGEMHGVVSVFWENTSAEPGD